MEKLGNSKILIISNDQELHSTVEPLLMSLGHPVIHAYSGKEGLCITSKNPPDLILLSATLPDMDGFELCRTFRQNKETSLLSIIMIAKAADKDIRIQGITSGCDDFLIGDFDNLELIVRVGSLLKLQYYRNQLNEREKLAIAINHSTDAMIITNHGGLPEQWNTTADHLFSLRRKALKENVFKTIKQYFEMKPSLEWDRIVESDIIKFELSRREKNDTPELILDSEMIPMRDNNSNIVGHFLVFKDITRISREEKRKDQFISLMAHKFRTASTIFMGSLELLQYLEEEEFSEETKELLENLQTGSERMNDIFDRILQITDLLGCKESILRKPMVYGSILKDIIQEVCYKLKMNYKETILFENFDEQLLIPLERKYLTKVCLEIIHNSQKYAQKEDLKITLSLLVNPKGSIELAIQDNGVGIPQEELSRIGNRFVQIEKGFSGNLPGLGMGMFLVQEIMDQIGAKFHVNSAPKEGVQTLLIF